jgi:hypothetical protein
MMSTTHLNLASRSKVSGTINVFTTWTGENRYLSPFAETRWYLSLLPNIQASSGKQSGDSCPFAYATGAQRHPCRVLLLQTKYRITTLAHRYIFTSNNLSSHYRNTNIYIRHKDKYHDWHIPDTITTLTCRTIRHVYVRNWSMSL